MTKRDWTIPLGPVKGKAGEQVILTAEAGCFFKGQLLLAITEQKFRVGRKDDAASKRVQSAKIVSLIVGDRVVFGVGVEPPVVENGTSYDRIEIRDSPIYWPGTKIAITLDFIKDGTWSGTLIGKGISTDELFPQIAKAFE